MRSLPVVVALLSSRAFAGGGEEAIAMLGFSLLEISCKASTAGSASSSSSSGAYARNTECDVSSDCHADYECRSNACVLRERTAPAPVTKGHTVQNVSTNRCPAGMVCEAPEWKEVAPINKCTFASQCAVGETCSNGLCASVPPGPQSSLRRQGSELYLRERAVELREELALGQGPVINGLAQVEGVSPKTLGRALREHRAELAKLIGDGPEWSAKFLTRVDALCGPS